jgi:hypothetical protein
MPSGRQANPISERDRLCVLADDGTDPAAVRTWYVAAAMAALGAIGLAVSTLTEHAIGVIATVMILVVTSEVVDNGRSWRRPGRTCPPTGGSLSTPCCARRSTPPPCSGGGCRSRLTR